MSAIFDLICIGRVNLNERGERDADNNWQSTPLLEALSPETMLNVRTPEEDEQRPPNTIAVLQLSDYHLTNEESGRTFHASIEIFLTLGEVEQLRAFLGVIRKTALAVFDEGMEQAAKDVADLQVKAERLLTLEHRRQHRERRRQRPARPNGEPH